MMIKNTKIKVVKTSTLISKKINKLLEAERKLFKKLGRKPEIEEIAKETKKSKNLISDINKMHMELYVKKINKNRDFAKRYADLGPIYGKQWRDFNEVDQLVDLVENLKNNPFSRRHILST